MTRYEFSLTALEAEEIRSSLVRSLSEERLNMASAARNGLISALPPHRQTISTLEDLLGRLQKIPTLEEGGDEA